MKNGTVILLGLMFIVGFTSSMLFNVLLNKNKQTNTHQAQNLTLRVESMSNGIGDAVVDVSVSGNIKIPMEYMCGIDLGDAITSNIITFETNDTTKWLSSKILNDGNWYSHHDHHLLCKYNVLDFYESDSIYYYKGDEIEHKSKVSHKNMR